MLSTCLQGSGGSWMQVFCCTSPWPKGISSAHREAVQLPCFCLLIFRVSVDTQGEGTCLPSWSLALTGRDLPCCMGCGDLHCFPAILPMWQGCCPWIYYFCWISEFFLCGFQVSVPILPVSMEQLSLPPLPPPPPPLIIIIIIVMVLYSRA